MGGTGYSDSMEVCSLSVHEERMGHDFAGEMIPSRSDALDRHGRAWAVPEL